MQARARIQTGIRVNRVVGELTCFGSGDGGSLSCGGLSSMGLRNCVRSELSSDSAAEDSSVVASAGTSVGTSAGTSAISSFAVGSSVFASTHDSSHPCDVPTEFSPQCTLTRDEALNLRGDRSLDADRPGLHAGAGAPIAPTIGAGREAPAEP